MKARISQITTQRNSRSAIDALYLKLDASDNAEMAGYADRAETRAIQEKITLELRRRWEREE